MELETVPVKYICVYIYVLVKLNVGLPWQKLHWTRSETLFTSTLGLNLRKNLVKCHIWSIALYGAETWTLRVADKHLESFEMWCWRRMEKISWTDHVGNEEVLLEVNEQRNILHAIRKLKSNWYGHILRRNGLLKQVIEGKIKGDIDVTRRQGWRRRKLLDDLKDRRRYYHLKEEVLDRSMWKDRFGRGFEPVVRQTTGWWWWCPYSMKEEAVDSNMWRDRFGRDFEQVVRQTAGWWCKFIA